jgi:hypothetical protein
VRADTIINNAVAQLKAIGVNTYMVMVIDPDTNETGFEYVGNEAEIFLQAEMVKMRILNNRLSGGPGPNVGEGDPL